DSPDVRTTLDSVVARHDDFALWNVYGGRPRLSYDAIEPVDYLGTARERLLVGRHQNHVVGDNATERGGVVGGHRIQPREMGLVDTLSAHGFSPSEQQPLWTDK